MSQPTKSNDYFEQEINELVETVIEIVENEEPALVYQNVRFEIAKVFSFRFAKLNETKDAERVRAVEAEKEYVRRAIVFELLTRCPCETAQCEHCMRVYKCLEVIDKESTPPEDNK